MTTTAGVKTLEDLRRKEFLQIPDCWYGTTNVALQYMTDEKTEICKVEQKVCNGIVWDLYYSNSPHPEMLMADLPKFAKINRQLSKEVSPVLISTGKAGYTRDNKHIFKAHAWNGEILRDTEISWRVGFSLSVGKNILTKMTVRDPKDDLRAAGMTELQILEWAKKFGFDLGEQTENHYETSFKACYHLGTLESRSHWGRTEHDRTTRQMSTDETKKWVDNFFERFARVELDSVV
jgi:hypothetical protein